MDPATSALLTDLCFDSTRNVGYDLAVNPAVMESAGNRALGAR